MKRLFVYLFLIFFISGGFGWSAYITKKSDTSKSVEKIEKDYANGKISKSECVKKKSKILKLAKVSQTICDNVTVKVVKKSKYIQKKSKEEKKVEYIKKKEKKEKKIKKNFTEKKKKLSTKVKKWIGKKDREREKKKVKKEKHYTTIAKLPKSDLYFVARDSKGNTYIGYLNQDQNSGSINAGNKKILKISEGKAFQDNGKTQCNVRSELNKVNKAIYRGDVIVKCPTEEFLGNWTQTGTKGFGQAGSQRTILDFSFFQDRKTAIASLKNKKKKSKETKKIVKVQEKNFEEKDTVKPVIKILYNKEIFESSDKNVVEVKMQSDSQNYTIEGEVSDNSGTENVTLRIAGKPVKIKNDGSFKFNGKISQGTEVWLNANDSSGLITDMKVEIEVLSASKKFINNKKYYALIIGNNDYERWDDLVSPINDTNEIAKVLKEKYKFKVTLLHNAKKDEMENALWDLSEKITEDDYLLIYYAGHGSKDVAIQKAYWIPTDAKAIDKPGKYWLSTSLIAEHAGRIKARHVLLMVDSCYAGLTVKGDNNVKADIERDLENPLYFKKMLNRRARLFISSGGDAPVPDTADGKHSLFATKFIEVLKFNNSSIDSEEVFIKVKKYVQNNSSDNPKYRPIKDIGHNDGVFVFSAKN